MKAFSGVRTPCIGVCSTGIGDSVCRGCKRFDYEVIRWNGFDQSEKVAIDNRLSQLLTQVVSWRLEITDLDLMVSQLKTQQVKYHETRDPFCWLFELLRAGAAQIKDPNQFGFAKLAMFEHKTLIDIRRDIDDEFYALSVAHYERYMVANRKRANRISAQETSDE
jgi:uncharacterized protein